jgi:hypothetical protein
MPALNRQVITMQRAIQCLVTSSLLGRISRRGKGVLMSALNRQVITIILSKVVLIFESKYCRLEMKPNSAKLSQYH